MSAPDGVSVDESAEPVAEVTQPALRVAPAAETEDPSAALPDALAEVRRRAAEYDEALRRLETVARQAGTPVTGVAEQRLAALDALVEYSRAALESEPTDPVLNAYLFAALDQRDDVVRQVSRPAAGGDGRVWR
jgi:hypothetical protein